MASINKKTISTNLLSLYCLLCMPVTVLAQTQLGADIDGEAAGDQSGYGVSLSADGYRMAIGALRNDGKGTDSGHVRVFRWSNATWEQLGTDIDGEAADDQHGRSVSLSSDGSRLAVGARLNDGNGLDSGHVRVYQWSGSAWVQLGTDIDGEAAEDGSGYSVSLSSDGSRLAIGAHSIPRVTAWRLVPLGMMAMATAPAMCVYTNGRVRRGHNWVPISMVKRPVTVLA